MRLVVSGAMLVGVVPTLTAQPPHVADFTRIRPAPGLMLVQALHVPGQAGGDRESFVTVEEVSSEGVTYSWQYQEVLATGDSIVGRLRTFVRRADEAEADRLHDAHGSGETQNYPGYTLWTLSTAVYERIRATGSSPFAIMRKQVVGTTGSPLESLMGGRAGPMLWRGTLARSSGPVDFPMIVNGLRMTVPALKLRGEFTGSRGRRWAPELWVLADSTYPLILRLVVDGEHVLQTVRVDIPLPVASVDGRPSRRERGVEGGGLPELAGGGRAERMLEKECRFEIPGIHFAFNSARLYPASHQPIAAMAALLTRHQSWRVTIEGHTDSIGTAASNQSLSERRAAAVRDRMVTSHQVSAERLRIQGFGAARPLESNATIEGRARNRRVELVRDCPGQSR